MLRARQHHSTSTQSMNRSSCIEPTLCNASDGISVPDAIASDTAFGPGEGVNAWMNGACRMNGLTRPASVSKNAGANAANAIPWSLQLSAQASIRLTKSDGYIVSWSLNQT